MAVLGFWIPLVSIFWSFVAIYVLARCLNTFAFQYKIEAPRATEYVVLVAVILSLPFVLSLQLRFVGFALFLPPVLHYILYYPSIACLIYGSISMARTAEAIQDAVRKNEH